MFIGSVKDISRFEFLVNCADRKIRVDKRNSRNVFEKDEVLVLEKEKQNKIIHVIFTRHQKNYRYILSSKK